MAPPESESPRASAGRTPDDFTRLALFEAWGESCAWCGRPLFFDLMEVDHLLPKSLKGDERAKVLKLHGKQEDADLDAIENLAPSCGPCNRGKGAKPPPDAPSITLLLDRANTRAPAIRDAAEQFRKRRGLQRALTLVVGAAKDGDAEAARRLREAADEVSAAVEAVVDRSPERLHSALDAISDAAARLASADDAFDYPVVTHRTGGAAPGLTPGTVIAVARSDGAFTTRIDAVPTAPDALERYGPLFTLHPTNDEAGRAAAELLEEALRVGRSIAIEEGLDLTLDRVPPGLGAFAGERFTGGRVELRPSGPVRQPIPDWDAELRAVWPDGTRESVRVLLRQVDEPPTGWDDALAGAVAGMSVTLMIRVRGERGQFASSFRHARDDSPVREQLPVLRFLEALSQGAQLEIHDRGRSGRQVLHMGSQASKPSAEARALLAFLEDMRVLEQWLRTEFALPDVITAQEAHAVAMLAMLVRERGRRTSWSDAQMRVVAEAIDDLQGGGAVTIDRPVYATILGRRVALGRLRTDLPDYEIASIEPVADEPNYLDVRIVPPGGAPAEVPEHLSPPKPPKSGRPPGPPRRRRPKHGKKTKKKGGGGRR